MGLNFFSKDLVKTINETIDNSNFSKKTGTFPFVTLSPVFMEIIANKEILDICEVLIDPFFRFDHAWGVQHFPNQNETETNENVHGGPFENQGFFQYHWHKEKPNCSSILMTIALDNQAGNEGGVAFIPGSHKSNLSIDECRNAIQNLYSNDFNKVPWIYTPKLNPGDLLIFTEATMHGTMKWTGQNRRRNLYFKYCYGNMGWLPQNNPDIQYLRKVARNEDEKALLQEAFVGKDIAPNIWRTRTLNKKISNFFSKLYNK